MRAGVLAPAPFALEGETMIYYEPHPVSPERKAELRGMGYNIIDARFAPADWVAPDAVEAKIEAPAKRRSRPRKVAD